MEKIKMMVFSIINIIVKILPKDLTGFVIANTAKVNYLGIRKSKNSVLKIGSHSMMFGKISFEKENATVSIGKNTCIGTSHLVCAKKIEIGDNVLISWGCTIVDHNSHSLSRKQRSKDVTDWYIGKKDWSPVAIKPVKIQNGSWLGFNVIVLKGVTIGEGAVVGAGSVVTKNVASYTVVAGNPAKFIKNITEK